MPAVSQLRERQPRRGPAKNRAASPLSGLVLLHQAAKKDDRRPEPPEPPSWPDVHFRGSVCTSVSCAKGNTLAKAGFTSPESTNCPSAGAPLRPSGLTVFAEAATGLSSKLPIVPFLVSFQDDFFCFLIVICGMCSTAQQWP